LRAIPGEILVEAFSRVDETIAKMFDDSQVAQLLTTITDDISEGKMILVDMGYVGIKRTIPKVMRAYQGPPHQELLPGQVGFAYMSRT
jgi:hypothetical protein